MKALVRTLLAGVVALCFAMPTFADQSNDQLASSDTQSAAPAASDQKAAPASDANSASSTTTNSATATNSDGSQTTTTTSTATTTTEAVNINTADFKAIKSALKVSTTRAKAIVSYRTKNGPFKSVDDLAKVKGVTKSWLDKNRDKVTTG